VNCGPRSNFLYIAIPFYFYSHCLLSCILLSFYHSIRSILCLHQIGEIDNLIVSWEQSSWLCCVQVSRCYWWKATRRQAVYLAPLSRVSRSWQASPSEDWHSPTGSIKPWFHNWGKTFCCAHHTFLLGFPTSFTYKPSLLFIYYATQVLLLMWSPETPCPMVWRWQYAHRVWLLG
jgi:hypothetical protein